MNSTDTTVRDDKVLDSPNTNQEKRFTNEDILVDSINSKIISRITSDEDTLISDSELQNDTFKDYNDPDYSSIPKYKEFYTKNSNFYKNRIYNSNNWIGYITAINDHSFEAKLIDKKELGTYEISNFDFDDVTPGDEKFIVRGAIFYWTLGHFMDNGVVKRGSLLRFKRGHDLNVEELDDIFDDAEELYNNIKWD